jgi:hypothetical protein
VNYRVLWSDDVANLLVGLLATHDAAAVTRAAERLDAALSYCPTRVGGERIAFEPPLAIRYVVDEDEGVVRISSIWATRN